MLMSCEINPRGHTFFISHWVKMLMRGDFDLNCTQRYADSRREDLKETMLNQELVFRKQVHELHRLYMTQKSLMDDLSWKEHNNYNSWKATTQLHASSIGYSMAEGRTFSSLPLVGSTHSIDQGMSGECPSNNKDQHHLPDYQQGPLDIRLPAERYVRFIGDDFSKREQAWNSPLVVNNYSLGGDSVSDSGEVNLSLGIGEDTRMKEFGITWYGNKTYPCSQEVIDLEKSIERVSIEGARPALSHDFDGPAIYSRNEQDLQVSVSSNSFFSKSEKKDPAEVITLVDGCGSSPQRSSFNPGPLVCRDDLPCENLLTKKQRLTSSGVWHIDLNQVQFDDSSCYSNDPLMVYPSTASSSIVLHGVVGESVEGVVTVQLNSEGSKTQGLAFSFPSQSQHTDQAASGSCAGENKSSSAKTMKSGIQLGDLNVSTSNDFSEILLGSEVAETVPGEQDLRSCHSGELKRQCYGKKEESPEVDVLITKAAESLVHLSLESSVCYPDSASKAGSEEMENDKKDQPEYSCDSYESFVLKLTESTVDDNSITSKPLEICEIEKKDFGVKLKRGRRMKDFQKDILPGLASLSRQEIREDINIMEGVIRSREYRKIRAKMGDAGNWSTPVKTRRPRRHYIGRRK